MRMTASAIRSSGLAVSAGSETDPPPAASACTTTGVLNGGVMSRVIGTNGGVPPPHRRRGSGEAQSLEHHSYLHRRQRECKRLVRRRSALGMVSDRFRRLCVEAARSVRHGGDLFVVVRQLWLALCGPTGERESHQPRSAAPSIMVLQRSTAWASARRRRLTIT